MARIYISLGSNIEPEQHIRAGLDALQQAFGTLTLSPVFEAEPVGFVSDNFINLVVATDTALDLAAVVAKLKGIEFALGRQDSIKKLAPRILDLDLLLYDQLCTLEPVVLPRPEITRHAFVLWPLAELAPELELPGTTDTLGDLWARFDAPQQLWKRPFDWAPKTES
ncbi:2-amino-4-hydroxy-6-hydroxymethyldihydropteridine diphosphokinase [Gallaecimonas sp. GXIMD4217]|uniref:2-amino-4-hydroxy-6- hydroxymethyldihydropteridine diphosphokinase n=1 Tax=Gallaecimonas sp. GXIMD4217 TaxID=3131927 RepID=UPI00311B0358